MITSKANSRSLEFKQNFVFLPYILYYEPDFVVCNEGRTE